MSIVRTTRGAFYRVGVQGSSARGPEIEIPGVVSVSYRLLRDFEFQDPLLPALAKNKSVFGLITLTDLDAALLLFDLTSFGGGAGFLIWDLIIKYSEGNLLKKKTFRDVMTGVSLGDNLGTFEPLVDDGSLQLHHISFMLRMPPGDRVSLHILTQDDS